MVLYSVIIPHRNIPKLLRRCLDSIPQRPDLEIIIVDDNSNPEIVDFGRFPGLERLDTRIVYDKSGLGAGHARNIGMKYAKGRWLIFADADDFFNYCFMDVLDEYADCEADIIFFKVSCIHCDYYTNSNRANGYNRKIQDYLEGLAGSETVMRYNECPPWGKLLRSSMVFENKILFSETIIHNDVKFSYVTGRYAKKISADQRAIYCLSYRPDSLSYTDSDEIILERARVYAERESFFQEVQTSLHGVARCIADLISLKEQGKMTMYRRCIDIFSEYGFSHVYIENLIKKEKRRRKIEHVLSLIKNGLVRINRVVRKRISA